MIAAELPPVVEHGAVYTACKEQAFPNTLHESAVALCVTFAWQADGHGVNVYAQQVKAFRTGGCSDVVGVCLRTGYTWIDNANGDERWSTSSPSLSESPCADGHCQHTWPFGGNGIVKVNTDRFSAHFLGTFYPAGGSAKSVDITVRIPS
ncbi:MAG TPA: hypothetical protein VMT27_07685 [Actinomycetes bacterium]|nr:hypothetical protein [Actinomycetes bacterium]